MLCYDHSTMSAESGSPSDYRENSRASLKAPASLQIDAFSEPLSGYTANVSLGGMFVEMADPPPVGSLVKFRVEMGFPAGAVSGTAEVVWMRPEKHGSTEPAGIGLQFRYVEEDGEPLLRTAVQLALEELGPLPETPPPVKKPRPRPPRPRPPAPDASAGKRAKPPASKKQKKKPVAPKKEKPDDSKQVLGMPAEKAKLIVLAVLVAFLLLYLLL